MIMLIYIFSFAFVMWLLVSASMPAQVKRIDGGSISSYIYNTAVPNDYFEVNYFSPMHAIQIEQIHNKVNVFWRKEPRVTEKGVIYI